MSASDVAPVIPSDVEGPPTASTSVIITNVHVGGGPSTLLGMTMGTP